MRIVIVFLLLVSMNAQAEEVWGFLPMTSIHFRHSKDGTDLKHKGGDTNEANYGLGIQVRRDNQDSINVGAYRNSFYRDSQYALYGFNLGVREWRSITFRAEFMAGLITGYSHEHDPSVYAAPVGSIEYRNWGVSALWVPSVVVAFGLKYRF